MVNYKTAFWFLLFLVIFIHKEDIMHYYYSNLQGTISAAVTANIITQPSTTNQQDLIDQNHKTSTTEKINYVHNRNHPIYTSTTKRIIPKNKNAVISSDHTAVQDNTEKSWLDQIFSKPDPISTQTKEIEKNILKYTNLERTKNGLPELFLDDALSTVARDHSLDMSQNNFFAHENLKGEDPTARARREGYNTHKILGNGWYSDGIGENIDKMPTGDVQGVGYVSSDPDGIAKVQVDQWMNSPGHRANILNDKYSVIGIGVAYDGTYYFTTQDFK